MAKTTGELRVTFTPEQMNEMADKIDGAVARWKESAERQKGSINHLSGIVESAKEVLRDSSASPDQMVAALKEILL